jgi:formate dehydrogenase maturation protein FdhE
MKVEATHPDPTHCPACGSSHLAGINADLPTAEHPFFRVDLKCVECETKWQAIFECSRIELTEHRP